MKWIKNEASFNKLLQEVNEGVEKEFAKKGRVVVGMNQSKTLNSPFKSTKEIFTIGVRGCTVVAARADYKDGTSSVHLSHFDNTNLHMQAEELTKMARSKKVKNMEVSIFVRGEWKFKHPKWQFVPSHAAEQEVDVLKESIEDVTEKIQIIPYSMYLPKGKRVARFVSLHIPTSEIMWWAGKKSL